MPHCRACIIEAHRVHGSRRFVTTLKATRKVSSEAPKTLSSENTTDPKKPPSVKPFKDIPGPSPSIPFFGASWQYAPLVGRYRSTELHDSYVDKYHRYGPVVREELQGRHPIVHLYDPEDVERALRKQGPQPTRHVMEFVKLYRTNNPDKYDTPGLAYSVGDEWKRLRNVLSPGLMKLNALDWFYGTMNSIANDFVDLLRALRDPVTHTIPSVQEVAYRLSLESVYTVSLDSRLGCLAPDLKPNTVAFELIDAVKLLFEAFEELLFSLPLWKYFETPSYKKLVKAECAMYKATNDRIEEAIRKLRESGSLDTGKGKPSLLETLLKTKNITDKEIRVALIDIISGGIFTVTNTFTFLLNNLARNPEVQSKLFREVMSVAPDGVMNSSRLNQLHYLKACVQESFRLIPIIPCITRMLPHDIQASGYHIPAWTPLFCHFSVACKQPDRFPDPDSFVPERWLNHGTKSNFALQPFGYGSRMCVGKKFAEMEIYTAVAKLVYNFGMESTGKEVKSKHMFIVVPTDEVSLIFRDR